MAVPEQHHFFLKRPRPLGHAVQPPPAQLQHTLKPQLVLLLLNLTAFLRGRFLDGLAQRFHAFGIGFCPGRIGRRIGNKFVVQQQGNGLVRTEIGQFFIGRRRSAKSGPVQQMRRGLKAPTTR